MDLMLYICIYNNLLSFLFRRVKRYYHYAMTTLYSDDINQDYKSSIIQNLWNVWIIQTIKILLSLLHLSYLCNCFNKTYSKRVADCFYGKHFEEKMKSSLSEYYTNIALQNSFIIVAPSELSWVLHTYVFFYI